MTNSLERNTMEQITNNLLCKKNKVRALYCEGYSRAEIAIFLKIANQDVREILIDSGYEDSETRQSSNSAECKSGHHTGLPTYPPLKVRNTDKKNVMEHIVDGMPKTADKIRALYVKGYSRSDIKNFLGIRYQHVRNVLVRSGYNEVKLEQPLSSADSEVNESPKIYPDSEWVKVGPAGRLVIPAKFRKALGIEEEKEVLIELKGNQLHILTWKENLRRIQEELKRHVPEGVSIVDELIAERRQELLAEEAETSKAKMSQPK